MNEEEKCVKDQEPLRTSGPDRQALMDHRFRVAPPLNGGQMISSNRHIPSHSVTLNTRQKHAIPLVLGARSIEEGCRAAGIAKQTWYRWMSDEAMKVAVSRCREEVISDALERLKTAVAFAVEGLTGLVEAEEKNIRLRACSEVLDYFMKARELEDMERRLCALERAVLREEKTGGFHDHQESYERS